MKNEALLMACTAHGWTGCRDHTFSGVSRTGAGAAAGFCRAFPLPFALDPRLSPRDPNTSMFRLRHLSWEHTDKHCFVLSK